MSDRSPPPYRSGLATGFGTVLLAGLVLAIADLVHTGAGAAPLLALLGLWAALAVPVGLALGLVLGAGNATWGYGWVRALFRRLRDDAELDTTVSAALVAAAILAGVLVLAIAVLADVLVVKVAKQAIGALLLGVVVVGMIPVLALAALPLYRAARRVTALVPAIGPLSRVLLLLVGALVAGSGASVFILRKLDVQALHLSTLVVPALLPVLAIVLGMIGYGPLARVRVAIPQRGVVVLVAAIVAATLPIVGLRKPSDDVRDAVVERSYIGPRLVAFLRGHIDRDHDGYSPFFGGPDCDDSNADIHPGATDIPGNGIDENCNGADAKAEAAPPPPHDAGAPAAPAISGGKNVLVIFIDTLRYDRLGITGYQRAGKSLTPRLDAFAKTAVVFSKAFAQAPNTPRSVPSFMTSQYPSHVKFDDRQKNYPKVLDDNDTLFEVMKAGGFTTLGESSHFYFCNHKLKPDPCPKVPVDSNILQGADDWDNSEAQPIFESNHDTAGPRIVKKTIAKLETLAKGDQKFAMIVHLFEPHSTYMQHEGFQYLAHGGMKTEFPEKYDYEVAFEDIQLGELFDALDKTGLSKTTTVVIMADHGEAMGEHVIAGEANYWHGNSLYREVLSVPMMFRIPGATPCMRDDVVQLIDLAPTIAALFGVKPAASWQGRSLVPALACQPLDKKPAIAEMLTSQEWPHEAKTMITADGKHQVIDRTTENKWEVYDIDKDKDEQTNLIDTPEGKAVKDELVQWIDSHGGGQ